MDKNQRTSAYARGVLARRTNELDARVGNRLKLRRTVLGMSQEALADRLGISWQQLQKYEAGINRISASRLVQLAEILRTDFSWFLRAENDAGPSEAERPANDQRRQSEQYSTPSRDEISSLLAAYSSISDMKVRGKAVELIQLLASADGRQHGRQ